MGSLVLVMAWVRVAASLDSGGLLGFHPGCHRRQALRQRLEGIGFGGLGHGLGEGGGSLPAVPPPWAPGGPPPLTGPAPELEGIGVGRLGHGLGEGGGGLASTRRLLGFQPAATADRPSARCWKAWGSFVLVMAWVSVAAASAASLGSRRAATADSPCASFPRARVGRLGHGLGERGGGLGASLGSMRAATADRPCASALEGIGVVGLGHGLGEGGGGLASVLGLQAGCHRRQALRQITARALGSLSWSWPG